LPRWAREALRRRNASPILSTWKSLIHATFATTIANRNLFG
jgi:hypothetical protein